MDDRITKLETPEQCERFGANALERGFPELADQARKRAVQLRAEAVGAKSQAEKEALQAVYAYEETLTKKNGRRTRASRTWQMIERHGIIEAVERAVNRPTETQGYTALVEMGLEEYAFEAVILRYPSLFSKEAVLRSRARLESWNEPVSQESRSTNHGSCYATITDAERISKAQSAFECRVVGAAAQIGPITLGFQGGGRESTAHFVAELGFWIAIADSHNRYWNALGTGNPFEGSTTIIAEINPPKSGIDRNIGGVFVESTDGRVFLAHRGKVGGGRAGIGKNAFLDWYPEPFDLVYDDDRQAPLIIVGALDDQELIENLARFTKRVAEFKDEVVS